MKSPVDPVWMNLCFTIGPQLWPFHSALPPWEDGRMMPGREMPTSDKNNFVGLVRGGLLTSSRKLSWLIWAEKDSIGGLLSITVKIIWKTENRAAGTIRTLVRMCFWLLLLRVCFLWYLHLCLDSSGLWILLEASVWLVHGYEVTYSIPVAGRGNRWGLSLHFALLYSICTS